MDGKIIKFDRAGVDAFKPVNEDLGNRDLAQWLGTIHVKCGCVLVHTYDIFVTFSKRLRGGWQPTIVTVNEKGAESVRKYGDSIVGTYDEIHQRFTEKLIEEQWWVIYNREPQTDKRY